LEIGFSVDAGHMLAQTSIPSEIHVMQTTFPGSFQSGTLVADLNQEPGDVLDAGGLNAGKLSVIDRGMWAHYFQRHLCLAVEATGDFFQNLWGVPDNTRQLDAFVDRTFASLTFYPYLQLVNHRLRSVPVDPPAALALFTAHPQWGTELLLQVNPEGTPELAQLRRSVLAWYKPILPPGTAYAAFPRLDGHGGDQVPIDALYAIAPLQFRVAELKLTRTYGQSFTYAQAQQVLGSMIDYYLPALKLAGRASGLTFDQQIELTQKSAAIDPDNYFTLAGLYLDHHQDDKAADAYQQWFDHAPDRVEVSNNIEWLVNYYYDRGQTDKAMALATDAAQVYSESGLNTILKLQEKMGQLDTAEDYGRKILERYNDSGALAAFYLRQLDKGATQYRQKFDQLSSAVFPDGLRKVTLASFSGAPRDGMSFTQSSDDLQHNGLSPDQVVVALDGYAVESQAQYVFVRSLSDSPTMQFIVWDGQAYRAITANEPGRHFGVEMRDYHP
jgi:tetratricopeptide (TPR) repeat protein